MAAIHNKYSQKMARTCATEMPDANGIEAFDLNQLNDNNKKSAGVDEDCDDIDFGNYKGIYANDD